MLIDGTALVPGCTDSVSSSRFADTIGCNVESIGWILLFLLCAPLKPSRMPTGDLSASLAAGSFSVPVSGLKRFFETPV